MKLFTVDQNYNLDLLTEELLLIPEFKATLDNERNKTDDDKKGIKKTRAFREWTFIWLYFDFESLFFKFNEQDKLEESLKAANMKKEDLEDPVFKAAAKRYVEIQENTPSFRMLKSVSQAVEKMRLFFEQVDPTEIDPMTNKPIYSAKDLMTNITNVKGMLASLRELHEFVKGEQQETKDIRGGQSLGLFDNV